MIVSPAELAWDAAGAPFNTRYGDIYASHDAAAEVHRVFIEPAGLHHRLKNERHLTVAELGFGSGLNFLTLADLALESGCRLHFLSAELHPFHAADLARLRSRCPAGARDLMDELLRGWPPLLAGWHRRYLAGGRVILSLWFGEVAGFMHQLQADQTYGIDAWLLDGFAPDRNPAMWTDEVFASMAVASRTGATATTFTSVGRVRRGLEAAGFRMRRVDQRPVKRESLAGVLDRPGRAHVPPATVQILGAGIAGCSLAAHLAMAGVEVRLLEPFDAPALGASQMRAAQHSRLLADGSPGAAWRAGSHLHSLAFTRGRAGVAPVGAVQLPGPNADTNRLERTLSAYAASGDWLQRVSPQDVAELAGASWLPADGGLWFAGAPVVELAALCSDLAASPGVTLTTAGQPEPDLPLVLANAQGLTGLAPFEGIPLHSLWGQSDQVELDEPPRVALLGDGYVLPGERYCVVGSTYEYSPWTEAAASATNLARLATRPFRWQGRQRAARLTTADRMPLVGQLGNTWVSSAHGSMGATSAHLAAAVVQSLIMGWAPPVTADVRAAVAPERFALRAAKKLSRQSPAR